MGPAITDLTDAPPFVRKTATDPETGEIVRTVDGTGATGGGLLRFDDIDMEVGYEATREYRLHPDDPSSASVRYTHDISFEREHWRVDLSTQTTLSCTKTHFVPSSSITTKLNGLEHFTRSWDNSIDRNGV